MNKLRQMRRGENITEKWTQKDLSKWRGQGEKKENGGGVEHDREWKITQMEENTRKVTEYREK